MPKIPSGAERVEMDGKMLAMLLDGVDVKYVKRAAAWTPPRTMSVRA